MPPWCCASARRTSVLPSAWSASSACARTRCCGRRASTRDSAAAGTPPAPRSTARGAPPEAATRAGEAPPPPFRPARRRRGDRPGALPGRVELHGRGDLDVELQPQFARARGGGTELLHLRGRRLAARLDPGGEESTAGPAGPN